MNAAHPTSLLQVHPGNQSGRIPLQNKRQKIQRKQLWNVRKSVLQQVIALDKRSTMEELSSSSLEVSSFENLQGVTKTNDRISQSMRDPSDVWELALGDSGAIGGSRRGGY